MYENCILVLQSERNYNYLAAINEITCYEIGT